MVEHYPNFLKTLRESLRKLVGEDVESRVEIGLAKDGSGVGGMILKNLFFLPDTELTGVTAALCALMAVKDA